ncbi:MAG TPA: DUF6691 family protein [Azospira sp.]|nr:DUF6691 family protein [Azospira sp.]
MSPAPARIAPMLSALVAGLTFGVGLILAGMTDPAKVLAFLDFSGTWDPSLAFVMGGAIGIALVPFYLARHRELSLTGTPLPPPSRQGVEARLLLGSTLFGIGWGLSGICPGPAIVNLGIGSVPAATFTLAMGAGMAAFQFWQKGRHQSSPLEGAADTPLATSPSHSQVI